MTISTKAIAALLVSSLTVVTAYVIFSLALRVNPLEALSEVGIFGAASVFAGLTVGELVRALRLYLLVHFVGARASLSSALTARLLGNLSGLLSPGSIAAEPTRVAVLISLNRIEVEKAFAAGLLESFYDAVVLSALTLAVGVIMLPKTAFAVLVSALLLIVWVAGLVATAREESPMLRLLERLARRFPRISGELSRRYAYFARVLSRTMGLSLHAAAFFTTLLAQYAQALGLAALLKYSPGEGPPAEPSSLVLLVGALSSTYVMSVMPTPGGSGFFELGLAAFLGERITVTWRALFLLFTVSGALASSFPLFRARRDLLRRALESLYLAEKPAGSTERDPRGTRKLRASLRPTKRAYAPSWHSNNLPAARQEG
ncbi:MAG: lysylphosphatidylglycerol synthase domain-containing protein [Fervidicoccaceae archaeon]